MLSSRRGLVVTVLAAIAVSGLNPLAALPGDARIMVVDFQSVVRNSDAAQSIHEQIDALRQGYQQEFGQIEDELRALEAELSEGRATLTADQFARRRRGFEQRVSEAQRQAQVRRAALDQALNRAMDEVRTTLLEVIADIARREDTDIVLSRAQVVLVDSALEFSDEALAELNARLPRVTVLEPGPGIEGE